jgi:ribose/xylose/arabinose/galactoside ABC-type transport system permease subunit
VWFLEVINNGMSIPNVPTDIQLVAEGRIILAAFAVSARASR